MSSTRSALCEIHVIQGQHENEFFLHTELADGGESGIKLFLTDIEDIWEGKLSEDDLDLLRARLKMDFKPYVEQTVAALTREKLKDIHFEYQLKALPSNRMQLVWKKCVAGDDTKILLGSVPLEKSKNTADHLRTIFAQSIATMSDLKTRINDLESNCDRLAQERQHAVKRLEKCVLAKEELERDLYSKFVAVLNSKKERIQRLEEEFSESLAEETNGTTLSGPSKTTVTSSGDSNNASPKQNAKKNDYSVDTDSEDGHSPVKQPRRAAVKDSDTSLNLGDEEDDKASVAPAVRRPRRKGPVKRETPSKAVLPMTSSTSTRSSSDRTKAGSVDRRTSLRKSGSNSSNKSSDNVDPDDLLDEM